MATGIVLKAVGQKMKAQSSGGESEGPPPSSHGPSVQFTGANGLNGLSFARQSRSLLAGMAVSPGTFGEVLQGTRSDNTAFLVTLPIHRYAKAIYFQPTPLDPGAPLAIEPLKKTKSLEIAHRLLAMRACRPIGRLRIESDIPEGKGLASSTADMIATVRAVEAGLGLKPLSPEQLAFLLCEIEPSDGIMYQNSVIFAHQTGQLIRKLPPLPTMDIIAVDEGGEVDTVAFNRSKRGFNPLYAAQHEELLHRLVCAFEGRDLQEVGRIATISAELNQAVLPKLRFDDCHHIAKKHGALGVVVAHSGTCLGLLFDRSRSDGQQQKLRAITDLISLGLSPWIETTIGEEQLWEPSRAPTEETVPDTQAIMKDQR